MVSSKSVVLVLSVAGIAFLGTWGWHAQRGLPMPWESTTGGTAVEAAPRPAPPAVAVETFEVITVAMPEEATAVGTLRSNESVRLRPEVSGRIRSIHFDEGQPVERGRLLIQFDDSVQRAELQQARANLELAESSFRRTADLFERNYVSLSAREEAASRLEVARAETALALARLERMRIEAPFSGTIGIRNISVGDYVKDGDALVNLEDISVLKVDFRLPEAYLQRIAPGQALEVVSDTLPGERFPARVLAIDPQVDAQGRAVVVRAELDNPEGRLRPGMFARIRVLLAERPAVAVVPEEALMPAPGEVQSVFKVVDGAVRRVDVRTGVRRNAMVEIVAGLSPGDVVVTAGQLKLRDGLAVRPVPPATDGDGALVTVGGAG